ncbi:MAG: toprim domain-containing protein [Oscillospiraceae bacterium]|nr:toprim domain-containing protein [Oscillospiraceae bacterium]
MSGFTREQLRQARVTNLYDFLIQNHEDDFYREGESIRFRENKSISIRKDFCGYHDFSENESGNSVDFLTRYMGYSLVDAVLALCDSDADYMLPARTETRDYTANTTKTEFPAETEDRPKRLYAYLKGRGIPYDITKMLIDKKILYQSQDYSNCVFINQERDWAEIRGTVTYGKPYHQTIYQRSKNDGYWAFSNDEDSEIAYICEGAIDAISLYLINKQQGITTPAQFISIGGVNKQPAIDRIKNTIGTVILAVDNDRAGQICRDKNPDLHAIIPINKDYNMDWMELNKE